MTDFDRENSLFELWGEEKTDKLPSEFEGIWPDEDRNEILQTENEGEN